jgi:hypothetical protein
VSFESIMIIPASEILIKDLSSRLESLSHSEVRVRLCTVIQ